MSRQEFSRQVSMEIANRAIDSNGAMRCEKCGLKIKGRNFQIDHIIADALRSDEDKKAKKLTAADGQLLCSGTPTSCHAIKTTKQDVPAIAKAKRAQAKDIGITKPKGDLKTRGFDPAPPKPRSDRVGKVDKNAIPPLQRTTMSGCYKLKDS